MELKNSKFVVKVMPSLTDFAFLMPIFFLFARMNGLQTLLTDCDTGWHIRTGEWILSHRAVPLHDLFSYSKPDGVWFAWEWLTDVIWAALNSIGGLAAVGAVGLLLIAFTFTLLFRLTRRKSNAIVAVVVTMTAAVASSLHWLARPHLFTLLFAVLFYSALENVRAGKTRFHGIPYLAILPFATILWTNLHGGFFVGIIMVGTYGVGEALKLVFGPDLGEQRRAVLTRAAGYVACSAACLAASLVNPYTYHLHQHVLQYLFDPYQAQHIMEFLSVSFHHPLAIFFEGILVFGLLATFWFASQGSFVEPLLLLMWAHAALLSQRNIPLFVIIAAPQVAAVIEVWLQRLPALSVADWLRRSGTKFNTVAASMSETDAISRWHPVSIMAVMVVLALMYAPHPPDKFRPEFDPKSFPVAAVGNLHLAASDRIFTSDQWGDYLIYRLYPETKVFMDGRSDFYGSAFNKDYLDILQVNTGWDKTLARFNVDTILMPCGSSLTGALKESARWRVVYDDGVAVVFRSMQKNAGKTNSITAGEGNGRDREITKTEARDRRITENKTKT